ncbi:MULTISPECIES: M3 family oligoendopeptidase [Bacillaceae]|uniref:M3 family oligoendopeptidase n=1 Tax=Bacillaceae TaxID=186817 RepID=UPI001E52F970|nr:MULTISPECIES: M3 family oligoendopeptidase [Bacillaceae]MCE4046966.1 M3 family oligoendopeptidase [Bacillus sp. Au-Bac7]MCM3030069.1 M3 family oligoendopeptidase [Niallia sp. MER 6]MDL0436518.1 M3 family oligoendopeptidase [Niallia sp. SS-2023]UPO86646.1 M3 family oligoendopeptidase [Niallia sp. Man26]
MTNKTFSDVWDLDVFFPGGSSSQAFVQHLDETGSNIEEFARAVGKYVPMDGAAERETVRHIIFLFEGTVKKIRQAGAFVSCLQAQNMNDKEADALRGKVTELSAKFQNVLTIFDGKLSQYEEKQWAILLKDEELKELSFVLTERRTNARQKLSEKEEMLINKLSIDGYHGWGQMYDTVVGSIQIPFEENGEVTFLSVGQAANKFSNPDRKVRKKVFAEWEKAWDEKGAVLAKTLNHLAGFRLNTYEMRNWDNVLKEPLEYNRMEEKTLEAMWRVISNNKKPFVEFLNRKAQMLGIDKLTWYDVDAPIGKTESKMSYQEGAEFILNHFEKFGEEMTGFAKKAFENAWIEAEDRHGKRPGGFHTYFPESGQSRIFMTYSGTPSNVSTLAHELGHGFHTYAMRDMHTLNRNYAMNVAETASTLAEMIVADAAVKNAKTKEEKISLLEDKIQRSVALLMNIHARFLFETRFYEERRKGLVSKERLNELMTDAQKEAFGDALAEYHPSFWGSKLHFYITGVPFYNFPYTFGYLFSLGIYAKAIQEGKGYERKYIALLKDTASMSVEELAKKHLNVDLTDDAFWESAIKVCIEDVEEFMELTR